MNSQFVIKNTFIEFSDEGADEDAFFPPRSLRRIQTCPQLFGSSPDSESDCASTASTCTSCGSQGATSDFSEPEEHLEAEDAMNQAWETDSENDIGQVDPAANVRMPFVGMPSETHTSQQYVLAFIPVVAAPHCSQEGNMGPNHVPAQPFLIGVHGDGLTHSALPKTTVMLRNLPNDYSREDALKLLDSQGFAGLYDFFYLPVDFDRGNGMGYAFVNFISPDHAENAKDVFDGFCDWTVASHKVCEVTWGHPLQGREAHEERFRNSPVMHESVSDHFKPLVFDKGIRVPFPPPTKRIRPPRTASRAQRQQIRRRGW